jgi:hypothetical protein
MIRYALPVRPILGDSKYLYSNFRALCRPAVCYYYVCVFPSLTLFSVSLVAATEFQIANRYNGGNTFVPRAPSPPNSVASR